VPESKSELVYQDLRRRIIEGDFSTGFRLVLSRLADEYDVSAVPVREALRRLEAEGLVRYTQNVGAEVVGVDSGDYAETMQVVATLEGLATGLAAPLLTAEQLEQARGLNREMRAVLTHLDPVLFTTLNMRFHRLLCGACPNVHLNDLLDREWDRLAQVRRSTFSYVPERSLTSVEEHEQMLEMIADGAPTQQLEALVREHKLRTMQRFLASDSGHREG